MELTPEQWLQIKDTVAGALELQFSAREAFVRQACLGDVVLIKEVLSLLSFDDSPPDRAAPAAKLIPGELLSGRYLIQRELGQGGFATTYLAQDRQLLNRRVVVKVLTTTETDPYILRKFHEELQALSSLEHPHIVAPLDSGLLASGAPFIVMQFAEGRTLRSLLSEGRIPLLRAGSILTQLARTLAFVHGKGIYHRDLKPENIIIQTYDDGTDHVRLIDFGIASIVDRGSTTQTRIVGSLSYMAPEQFMGQVNPQTDIYAFGVVAYEVITGILPFRANSPIELMQVQREGTLIHPMQLASELSPQAERLILQALAFQPDKRPANTALFADQMAQITWAAPLPDRRPSSPRSSRWLWLLALAPLAILAVWLAWHVKPTPPRASATPAALSASILPSPTLTVQLIKRQAMLPARIDAQESVPLQAGEDFRLSLQSNTPGHVYLFSLGANSPDLHILFPSPTSYQSRSSIPQNESVAIPEKTWFRFDAKPDSETIFIVWSASAQPDLEAAIQWANPRDRGLIAPSAFRASLLRLLQTSPNALTQSGTQWQLTPRQDPAIGWIRISHPSMS